MAFADPYCNYLPGNQAEFADGHHSVMLRTKPADMKRESVIDVMGFNVLCFSADFAGMPRDIVPPEKLVKPPPRAFFVWHRGLFFHGIAMKHRYLHKPYTSNVPQGTTLYKV